MSQDAWMRWPEVSRGTRSGVGVSRIAMNIEAGFGCPPVVRIGLPGMFVLPRRCLAGLREPSPTRELEDENRQTVNQHMCAVPRLRQLWV